MEVTMSFEPIFDECKKCYNYIMGDGKIFISACKVDLGPSEVDVPDYCPMIKEEEEKEE